ncbi:unnamed protein product [Eruca vesicaria subsp. sativa]|uniref:Alpha/beta hydrolase fold-3 domain-containing protein n=1 Tax=Eruca vesicaria subsp. sativa TaxID=29727 RepID=A0ABC8L0M3_ERUVS|nr:unnamed protein product [Eruca vesicaria subsp. sativa]
MSESSPDSDPYALIGIIKNPNGSITRDPTRIPSAPATPEPSPQNPVVSKDIIVSQTNSTWMRLYVPSTNLLRSSQKLTLLLYFHAGGFITCSVDFQLFHDFCNLMAHELNVVVASASYRLAPEFKLPAAYDDGEDALEWLRNSKDAWINSHADLSNVYIMGSNAGGNLAYNVGIRYVFADLRPLSIRGLILHHPFFGGESELRHVNVNDQAVGELCWKLCLPVGANRDHEYSNPTVRDEPEIMKAIGRSGWKVMVMVSGGRQRDVAKLMNEKGVDMVEAVQGDLNNPETMFASIRKLIVEASPI